MRMKSAQMGSMATMTFVKRHKRTFILVLVVVAAIFLYTHRISYIEWKLVSAINQHCAEEGECDIDLAEVFAGFEWDTVSVFVAGDPLEVEAVLGVYNDTSDGIVFSREGKPVKKHLSSYGFPEDIPPLISYYVERANPYLPCYVSFPREQAVVHAEKYRFHDGSYKYSIVARNPS